MIPAKGGRANCSQIARATPAHPLPHRPIPGIPHLALALTPCQGRNGTTIRYPRLLACQAAVSRPVPTMSGSPNAFLGLTKQQTFRTHEAIQRKAVAAPGLEGGKHHCRAGRTEQDAEKCSRLLACRGW